MSRKINTPELLKQKRKEQKARRKARDPESFIFQAKLRKVKHFYGLAPERYKDMLERQDGKCVICDKGETTVVNGRVLSLSVDHCHDTGMVRALLCGTCNRLIGLAKECPALLRSAALYLEQHSISSEVNPELKLTKELENE
jgi:hypothetical protein